jgi:tetratricopeptide (TPR) repeat protein
MAPEASTPTARTSTDRQSVIEALEKQLAATPRAARPHEHATVAYRLGLAYAESPVGTPAENLRKALALYEVAGDVFNPRFDPVEHARVLNAAGAAHRALGDRRRAARLFEEAARLLDDRGRDDERAAALNNLGLVRTELGELALAVEACDQAVELFDTTSDGGRRGRVATLHSRGQAHAAMGTEEGLDAALADFELARGELDPDDAPYHFGLIHHSIGVAFSSLAALRPDERERLLGEAIDAFTESLTVFTRSSFPYQHALAKHNAGLAWAGLGGVSNLRRALACFEDSVGMLDLRLHGDAWRQAYASLSRVEEELEQQFPGMSRPTHFASLVAGAKPEERRTLVGERLTGLLALPEPRRRAVLTELALASAQLDPEQLQGAVEAELRVLMELPTEALDAGLRARFDAHRQLSPEAQQQADRALEAAIGAALGGPQRIAVRDFLYSLGWERP